MRNILKNKLIIITIIYLLILFIFSNNVLAISMVEYDDETADKQANEDLRQQEIEDKENLGKSSNNFLSELSVEGYELTPKFDKQIINYSIKKEVTKKTISINAKADDERATILGDGEIRFTNW